MTLKMRAVAVLVAALAVSAIAMAACGGPTTTDIIQTTQAEEQNARATRTAEAGGGALNVGQGSAAEKARTAIAETAAARQTVEAGNTPTVVGGTGSNLPFGDLQPDAIEGEPQTGEVVVEIGLNGLFTPQQVKVTVGTTVTWETIQRTASSTTAIAGQEDSWDSGPLSKQTFDQGPKLWSRVFEIPGCFQYQSRQSGQSSTGAVCVVE